MVRAFSSNRLPPWSQNHVFESFRVRSSSSASSCDDIPHSPFRPRSFSNTSSTSQTSAFYLPELTIPNYDKLVGNNGFETDLDDIILNDLNLESGQNIPVTATIRRHYLHGHEINWGDEYLENPIIKVCNSFLLNSKLWQLHRSEKAIFDQLSTQFSSTQLNWVKSDTTTFMALLDGLGQWNSGCNLIWP